MLKATEWKIELTLQISRLFLIYYFKSITDSRGKAGTRGILLSTLNHVFYESPKISYFSLSKGDHLWTMWFRPFDTQDTQIVGDL